MEPRRGPSPTPVRDLFPILRGHEAGEILRHKFPQDLGDTSELGMVIVKLGLVDESCQVDSILS